MAACPPTLIALDPDDDTARDVGHTSDGRQFFLTTPFVPAARGSAGCEFIALYLFDGHGALLDAHVESLGPRSRVDENHARGRIAALLASLGSIERRRITMAPFRVERFGLEFGLVLSPPDDPEDEPVFIMEPGNFMAFFPPWDSGDYDT